MDINTFLSSSNKAESPSQYLSTASPRPISGRFRRGCLPVPSACTGRGRSRRCISSGLSSASGAPGTTSREMSGRFIWPGIFSLRPTPTQK